MKRWQTLFEFSDAKTGVNVPQMDNYINELIDHYKENIPAFWEGNIAPNFNYGIGVMPGRPLLVGLNWGWQHNIKVLKKGKIDPDKLDAGRREGHGEMFPDPGDEELSDAHIEKIKAVCDSFKRGKSVEYVDSDGETKTIGPFNFAGSTLITKDDNSSKEKWCFPNASEWKYQKNAASMLMRLGLLKQGQEKNWAQMQLLPIRSENDKHLDRVLAQCSGFPTKKDMLKEAFRFIKDILKPPVTVITYNVDKMEKQVEQAKGYKLVWSSDRATRKGTNLKGVRIFTDGKNPLILLPHASAFGYVVTSKLEEYFNKTEEDIKMLRKLFG